MRTSTEKIRTPFCCPCPSEKTGSQHKIRTKIGQGQDPDSAVRLTPTQTTNGDLNKKQIPCQGRTARPLTRLVPADYCDGKSAPRCARNGKPLPNARVLSNAFHMDKKDKERFERKKIKPDAGLEPATVGLKVQRSTD